MSLDSLQSYLYYIVLKLCPLVYASFLNLDLTDDLIKLANKDHQLLKSFLHGFVVSVSLVW